MKAVVYNGPRDIQVLKVPDAVIERPTDVLIEITTTNICGSDLHMYEGRTDVAKGTVLGHENLGRVIEIGSAVQRMKVGDWACIPFNIACGFCRNCERGFTSACLTTNPPKAGAAYGYAEMGPYPGGQAELLRVPYGANPVLDRGIWSGSWKPLRDDPRFQALLADPKNNESLVP